MTPREAGEPVIDELAVRRQRRRDPRAHRCGRRRRCRRARPWVAWSTTWRSSARSWWCRSSCKPSRIGRTELLAAPDATDRHRPRPMNGGQVSFVVSDELNRAMFDRHRPAGRRVPATATSCGRSTAAPRSRRRTTSSTRAPTSRTFFSGDVADKAALAVSIEPAGTVPAAPDAADPGRRARGLSAPAHRLPPGGGAERCQWPVTGCARARSRPRRQLAPRWTSGAPRSRPCSTGSPPATTWPTTCSRSARTGPGAG